MCKIRSHLECAQPTALLGLSRVFPAFVRLFPPITCTNDFVPPRPLCYAHHISTMVKVIIKGSDTVVAEASETVYIEGNHYFAPEAIKVDLSISDTT